MSKSNKVQKTLKTSASKNGKKEGEEESNTIHSQNEAIKEGSVTTGEDKKAVKD